MKKDYIEVVVNSTTKAYYKEKGYPSSAVIESIIFAVFKAKIGQQKLFAQ